MIRDKVLSASVRRSGVGAFLFGFALMLIGMRADPSGDIEPLVFGGFLIAAIATPMMIAGGRSSFRDLSRGLDGVRLRFSPRNIAAGVVEHGSTALVGGAYVAVMAILAVVSLVIITVVGLAVLGLIAFGLRQL